MILLPIISFFLFIPVFRRALPREGRFFSLLSAVTAHTGLVLLFTELLSAFRALTAPALCACYAAAAFTEAVLIVILRRHGRPGRGGNPDETAPAGGKSPVPPCPAVIRFVKGPGAALNVLSVIVMAGAVYLALRTVPYNWDSMTYHLTRIAHWAQNRSVAHYACHDISQISDPALAEFIGLHLYLLTGNSDVLLNLIQTLSFILTALIVGRISLRIGCGRLTASAAVLVYVTTPIVFGEALTTQVDIFCGLWLMIFAYYSLDFVRRDLALTLDGTNTAKLILLGMAAGFSYAAKASASIGVLVFAVWIVGACIARRDRAGAVLGAVGINLVTAAAVIAPELVRNLKTFGSFAAEESGVGFLVPSLSPRYLILNCAENLVFNLTTPWLKVTPLLDKVVYKLMYILFGSTETPAGLKRFVLDSEAVSLSHDSAANPLIMWLSVLCAAYGVFIIAARLVRREKISCSRESWYTVAAAAAALAFFTAAKWYPFITRYECGYFALLSPAAARALKSLGRRHRALMYGAVGIIVFTSLVKYQDLVLYHQRFVHRGGDRAEDYFLVRNMYYNYDLTASEILAKDYHSVGFVCGPDSYEYPLWKMLEEGGVRIEHVAVDNETAVYGDPAFVPDCVVLADLEPAEAIAVGNRTYRPVLESGSLVLYEPD